MDHTDRILQLMRRKNYTPLNLEDLAEKLNVAQEEIPDFRKNIDRLLHAGTITRIKRNRYCLPRDADLVTGTIRFRQSGAAILLPDPPKPGQPRGEVFQIRAEDTWVALHGDRVVARIQDAPPKQRPRRGTPGRNRSEERNARVIRILERKRETLTGTLQKSRLFHFVVPDDPRIIQDILVPEPAKAKIKPAPRIGDKIIVRLHEWKQRHLNPEGEIIQVLGRTHTPSAEFRALLHQYDLDPEFPKPVEKEVAGLPDRVRKSDLPGRIDLRELNVFTIDPDDAKDFDDALSIERFDNGDVRIGIHIADVSHYVRSGTALDTEANKRGNSTYLVGQVIPMLPHKLSNGLCSLVEGEDRLVKSVFITYSPKAREIESRFASSVIRSRKRLTYRQAHALLTEDRLEKIRNTPLPPEHQTGAIGRPLSDLSNREIKALQEDIRSLWDIGRRLRKRRMDKGSLDLDMPEMKIFVDEQGYADRIERIEYDESHQLIEEFMLAANEAVARELRRVNVPMIHRVHDKPDPDRLDELRLFMATVGIEVGDLTKRSEVTKLLRAIKSHPQAYTLRIQFLRSLKQACYRASADGHYGLNKTNYTHFTSPIRRYSDLVIHRVFARFMEKHPAIVVSEGIRRIDAGKEPRDATPKTVSYRQGQLELIAEHLSQTEQNSTEAERQSIQVKLLEFFERELKKEKPSEFEAVIMDVKNHGMFVELTKSMAYGLVHISTLRDDLYHLNDDGTAIIGRRSKKRFEVGQKVSVRVSRIDRFKRQIDFAILDTENGRQAGRARKRGGNTARSANQSDNKSRGARKKAVADAAEIPRKRRGGGKRQRR